jgi:hypothetical protein
VRACVTRLTLDTFWERRMQLCLKVSEAFPKDVELVTRLRDTTRTRVVRHDVLNDAVRVATRTRARASHARRS